MFRPFARSLVSVALTGSLFLVARAVHAQEGEEGGDVMEEKDDHASEDDSSGDDGGWNGEEEAAGDSGGLHFGLRLAFGLPLGDVAGTSSSTSGNTTTTTSGGKMSDWTLGQIPIWVDLGWQASRKLMIGGYFSYGFAILHGQLKDYCDQGNARCSLGDIRAGAQFQFSFSPGASADPWLGAGLGYEWLHLNTKNGSATLRGWELPMIQAGLDFQSAGKAAVGPFVAFSLATYSRMSQSAGGSTSSDNVDPTAMHEWLFIGVRGALK